MPYSFENLGQQNEVLGIIWNDIRINNSSEIKTPASSLQRNCEKGSRSNVQSSYYYSSWIGGVSLTVLATKEDGSLGFCIDFRKLNSVMKIDKWQLPCVKYIFNDLRGSSVLATLDLFQDYCQTKMHESYKERTTLPFTFETYLSEIMPFGSNTSSSTLLRMIENSLAKASTVKCWVDDVHIHSSTNESHSVHLFRVFVSLLHHRIHIRAKKR